MIVLKFILKLAGASALLYVVVLGVIKHFDWLIIRGKKK